MEFEGHQLHTIDKCWVFDLTTFIGYYIRFEENQVNSYQKAFMVKRDAVTGSYVFEKTMKVPVKVMRKTVNIVQNYRKEALLEDECN